MVYICVRTYGNGNYMNKVYPIYYQYLSQAKKAVDILNEQDLDCKEPGSDRWIYMPIYEFIGPV